MSRVWADDHASKDQSQLEQEAVQYNDRAVERFQRGDSEGAVRAILKAIELQEKLYPEKQGHPALAQSLYNLAFMYNSSRQPGLALANHERAMKMREVFADTYAEGRADLEDSLNGLGATCLALQRPEEALPHFQRAVKLREKLAPAKNSPELALVLDHLGQTLIALGRGEEARRHLESALKIREAEFQNRGDLKSRLTLASTLQNVGAANDCLRKPEQSVHYHELALKLYEELSIVNRPAEYSRCVNGLGCGLAAIGQPDIAIRYLAQAESLLKIWYPDHAYPAGHPERVKNLGYLGWAYTSLGEPGRGLPYLEKSLEMRERLFPAVRFPNGNRELVISLNNLATGLANLRQPERAVIHLQRAIRMCEKLYPESELTSDHALAAATQLNLAWVLYSLQGAETALPIMERVLVLRERLYKDFKSGHVDLAESLASVGLMLVNTGELTEAASYYERGLKMMESLYDPVRFPKGHPRISSLLNNLGLIYLRAGDLQNLKMSADYLTRAVEMDERLYDAELFPHGHPNLVISLHNRATAHYIGGDVGQALDCVERALKMGVGILQREAVLAPEAEAIDFAAFLPKSRELFLRLTEITKHSDLATYEMIWATRSPITEVLRQRTFAFVETAKILNMRRRITGLRAQLSSAILLPESEPRRNDRVRETSTQLAEAERQMLAEIRQFARSSSVTGLPQDLAAKLPPKAVFLDVVRHQKLDQEDNLQPHYVVFVVAHGKSPVRVNLGATRSIDQVANAWRNAVKSWGAYNLPRQALTDLEQQAQNLALELKQLVWMPLALHLPADTTSVYLAIDGELSRFPFAVLPDEKAGELLFERMTFATVPDGRFLLERLQSPDDRASETARILAVGGVDYGLAKEKPRYRELPGTVKEIDQLKQLGGENVKVLSGKAATAEALLRELPGFEFVHIGTHGEFAEELLSADRRLLKQSEFEMRRVDILAGHSIERIGLGARNPLAYVHFAFAGANQSDQAGRHRGVLSGEMFVGLKLPHLRVAMLSACDTGIGGQLDAEGMRSFASAFLLAGGRNVVASLWHVDDEATAALTNAFWDGVFNRKLTPVEALTNAQMLLFRRPDLVPTMANRSSPDFEHAVKINPRTEPAPKPLPQATKARSHPYFWASFVLSGSGQ